MALIVSKFVFQNLCIAAAYRPVEELLEEEKVIQFNFFFFMIYTPFYTEPRHLLCLFLLECLCLVDLGKFLSCFGHNNIFCIISLMVKIFRF